MSTVSPINLSSPRSLPDDGAFPSSLAVATNTARTKKSLEADELQEVNRVNNSRRASPLLEAVEEVEFPASALHIDMREARHGDACDPHNNKGKQSSQSSPFPEPSRNGVDIPRTDGPRHEDTNNNISLKSECENDDEGEGTEDANTVGPSFTTAEDRCGRGLPSTSLETSNNVFTKEKPSIAVEYPTADAFFATPSSLRFNNALNQNETTIRTTRRRPRPRNTDMVRNRRARAPQSLCSLLAERFVSVVSLTGFIAFASGLVCLIVILIAVSLTSAVDNNQRSGAADEEDFLLNSFSVQMRSVVAPEAFRPLIQSFLQLDKTQHFGMQRAEVEETITTQRKPTYGVNTTEPPREEIFAPTADASALLPLGPFISELMSHSISSVHQIHSELEVKTGLLSQVAYRLPHVSVSLEDGRHVYLGFRYFDNLCVTVLDGGDPNRTFSGEFAGVFPLLNRSTMPNNQARSTVHVNTTPPGRTVEHRPMYYTYSERLISIHDGSPTSELSPNPTFTADVSSTMSEVWSPPTPQSQPSPRISTRWMWENLGFTRRSLRYDAARGTMAPMQKRVYGLVQSNAVTLTFVAPIYTRWPRIIKGNSYQRPLAPYRSSETDAQYLENIINENYVFIGVAMSQLSLEGLRDHLIGLLRTFQSNRNTALVDESVPIPELFLLRRDIVWATSHEDRSSYSLNVNSEKDSTDQDGVTLCDPSYCAHTIQSYRYGPLLAAYQAHPAIAKPSRAKPSPAPTNPPPSAARAEERVKAFMMSSSSVGLNQEGTGGNAMFTHVNNKIGEAELWFLSYSEMAPPSTAQRPFGDAADSVTPFVLLALARAPASYLLSRGGRCGANLRVLIAIAVVTLLIVGVLAGVVSRIILRPLSEISVLISKGAHLRVVIERSSGSSSSPTDGDEALRAEEELRRQMSDRTPSSWLEVRCLQKAYWLMSDQLQTLAAYIPENVMEELLDATRTGKSRWPGRSDRIGRSLDRNHRSSDSPSHHNRNGGYSSSSSAGAAAATAFGGIQPYRTPRRSSVETESCSSTAERTHSNKNPVHNVLRGRPPLPPLSAKLDTVGVEGLAVEMTNSTSKPARPGSEVSNIRTSMHSMLSLGVVLESQNEGDSISSSAGSSSGVPRPILFADRVLVDRDITAVHINIISFHQYAENTPGVTISRDYESFISFIHSEARRFGGMLESFSGDKVWVSFNASSKCTNGPVAAAYYAYSVTSAINNAVVRRGAVRSKSFSHPIFTSSSGRERYFRVARCGVTCGIATGRAFVGPLGNSSVKRHTIISNTISEAAALERQALRYPGCNVLMAGDMIPAVEGYCQYLLIDATLLPGSCKKRRRLACVKGPMLASSKDPTVFRELWINSSQGQSNGTGNIPKSNPYAKINDAMTAFLEGQAERCKQLVAEITTAGLNITTVTAGISSTSEGKGAADANECEWDRKERSSLLEIMVRFFEMLFTLNIEGRSYKSQLGEQYAPKSHALCAYIPGEFGLEVSKREDNDMRPTARVNLFF